MEHFESRNLVTVPFEGYKIHHARVEMAVRTQNELDQIAPGLKIYGVTEDGVKIDRFLVLDHYGTEVYEGRTLPTVDHLIELADEAGAELTLPEDGEDEDEDRPSSIVPLKYRVMYAEVSSTKRSCGDWLAEQLAADTLDGEKRLIVEAFWAVLKNNCVDTSGKWAQAVDANIRGSIGRWRMNGRQKLEVEVARNGQYIDPTGAVITPPAEWLEEMHQKHHKRLSK